MPVADVGGWGQGPGAGGRLDGDGLRRVCGTKPAREVRSLIGYMPENDSFIASMSGVRFRNLGTYSLA
jgi:hypothetical protein